MRKNIFAFIIFFVCSLKLSASEFFLHTISTANNSATITILKRKTDGSISYFGEIKREKMRYYFSREKGVASHNFHYMLSFNAEEMCFKNQNGIIGRLSNQNDVYDLNDKRVMAGFVWDQLGYNVVNYRNTSLGRLEFCAQFAKVKFYKSEDKQKLAMLLLMAAKKILSAK